MTALDPNGILKRLQAGENIKLLRQSTIGSADICLKRAGFDMRPGRPRKSGEARCVGTSYHAGLEALYRRFQEHDIDPGFYTDPTRGSILQAARVAFDSEAALFDFWPSGIDVAWQRVTDLIDTYCNGGHFWSPESYEVIGVEQEWFLPLHDDWSIKGSIDLVLRDRSTDEVILVDHKTAGRAWAKDKHLPHKQVQAPVYCWAWWRLTGTIPAFMAFDVITYKGVFDRRECHVESRHMEAVLSKAIGLGYLYDNVPFPYLPGNTSHALCSALYCDHWSECVFGAALSAPSAMHSIRSHDAQPVHELEAAA